MHGFMWNVYAPERICGQHAVKCILQQQGMTYIHIYMYTVYIRFMRTSLWMHVEQFNFFLLLPIMQLNKKKRKKKKRPLKALPTVQSSIPCILLDIRSSEG